MKFSKLLLYGIAGTALAVIIRKFVNVEKDATAEDEVLFDADFIQGSKKLHLDIPDHINPSWFRLPRYQSEDSSDPMFI